jgi:hypothetical protein
MEDLCAPDRALTVIGESHPAIVIHERVEIRLRSKVEDMNFGGPLTSEVPETVDHLPTVLGDQGQHEVLISNHLVETPRNRPQQHAEIDRVWHRFRLRRRRLELVQPSGQDLPVGPAFAQADHGRSH